MENFLCKLLKPVVEEVFSHLTADKADTHDVFCLFISMFIKAIIIQAPPEEVRGVI